MNAQKTQEKVIYLIFWILVFTFPVLLSTGGSHIDWVRVSHEVLRISPFFLVFLVNNFLLFGLFKNKHFVQYFLYAGITALVFSFIGSFEPLIYKTLDIPPPPSPPGRLDAMRLLNVFFYNCVFSVLVMGLNNAIKITIDWHQERRNFEQLQKEHFKNQLSLLQHQVSPHFLMNTLNNIHALIDYDKEIAKNSVVKLSKLMRVLLYENNNYTLDKEIEFLTDYIELVKIRVNHNVEIIFSYPEILPQASLPPLLFINLVENAFKHGILATGKSFIHITFALEYDHLCVNIRNSRSSAARGDVTDERIGLINSRKRLDLIYGNNYFFEVNETDTTFEVNVKVPLDEDKVPGH
jgi:hypothetical protein